MTSETASDKIIVHNAQVSAFPISTAVTTVYHRAGRDASIMFKVLNNATWRIKTQNQKKGCDESQWR